MQRSISELKDKLVRALDKDNNVVDIQTVLEVISCLERSHVTRECLEDTRVGKYVNEMRKKTSNKDLAKRAKNLVKKWQALVIPQAATATGSTTFNGSKSAPSAVPAHVRLPLQKPVSPASRSTTPNSSKSGSPGLSKSSRPSTPHNYANRLSPAVSQKGTAAGAFKPISPALQTPMRPSTTCVGRQSPMDIPRSHNGSHERAPTPSDNPSNIPKAVLKRKQKDCASSVPEKKQCTGEDSLNLDSKSSSVMNGFIKGPHLDSVITSHSKELFAEQSTNIYKTPDVNNGRKGKSKHQLARIPSTASVHSDSTLDSTPSKTPSSTNRTPRVKTTAQLLEEMASKGSLNIAGSEAVRKITLNQIDKEHDDVSIVPAGAKPRPRKKPRNIAPPQINEKPLRATKDEMVHKFLETSLPIPPTPDADLPDSMRFHNESPSNGLGNKSHSCSSFNGSFHTTNDSMLHSHNHTDNADLLGKTDSLLNESEFDTRRVSPVKIKLSSCRENTEQSISDNTTDSKSVPLPVLPAIDADTIDWQSLDYDPPEPLEVTPTVIEHLHSGQWPGVNGQRDAWGDWRSWTQTYSASSYNGDLLHILPYVVLDLDNSNDEESGVQNNDTISANTFPSQNSLNSDSDGGLQTG